MNPILLVHCSEAPEPIWCSLDGVWLVESKTLCIKICNQPINHRAAKVAFNISEMV